ncbi:YDG domain-containing protein, partial [Flavobacterium caeni]
MNLTLARKHLGTLWLLLLFFATGISWAQVSIGSLPYTKTDNFNSYNGSGPAALPTGWTMLGATNYRGQGTGTSNTGGFYAFGSGSDYSLGALRSSSNNYTYAVSFTNNTGSTITQLVISWNYEQWRYANTSGWDCTGTGALASNATLNGKDFVGSASGTSGSVTTTAVASFTLSGLSIANGQTFGIQWVTTDQGSSDNGVSIDDFSLQASGSGGPQNQTITFNALTSQTYGVAPYLLSATSTSGLTVSFASSNTNVAQISGNTITIVGAGSTNITASQAGNAGFNPATNVVRALTVNPKTITATGAVASDKSYDRSTSANITGAIAQGLVGTDEITVTGGGNFDDFNVGDNKPVTAALTLSGTKASSYTLTQPVGLSASITPKDLTIAGAAVANKPYDGNTSATLIGTLNGVISPDDVVLSALASFEFPFAGTGIPAISEAFLVGADIANYNLVQPTGLAADITPKQLTVVGALALNKVYDGNTDAVITGTLDGVIAPDEVIFNGVGIFESPNVGTEIPVESVSFLTGDIANYELVQPTGLFATISAEALLPQEITFNPLADAYYGDANFNLDATASSALAVTYASSDENIATVSGHTVTVVGVGSTIITAMQSGDSTYDMAIPVSQTLNVLPKELTIANLIVSDKIYDGTDAVSLSADLEGVVGSEDVTLIFTAAFSSVNVGTDVPVNASFSLQGNDIANYTLTQPTDLSADITAKTLTIDSVVANDKPYDGSTAATLSNITFSGNVAGDDVTLSGNGQFADANAAQDIAVTVTLALDGAQAGNYSFTQPAGLSADITPLVLTISGLSVEDKIYDATDAATLNGSGTLEGVINAEDVTLGGSPSATFNNASVGVNKPVTIAGFTLSGTGAQNYTLEGAAGLTADITAKSVTVSGAVANAKPYDGTTAATLSDTGVLSGVEPTDEGQVSVSNVATFASSAIGNNIAVTLALTGTKAPNYSLTQPGITASITAGPCAPSTVTWNFNTASPSSAAVANLSVSALSQGNNNGSTTLITSTSASNNAGASGGNNAGAAARTGALSLATSAYFEFSLTPATGYTARLTGINFGSRSTGTGPQAYAIRSSLDNYATNLASAFMSANSTWSAHTPSLTATSGNPGTQVTYRIYGYNGTGSPASGTANWRIDDLNLAVTVAAGLSSSTSATACSGSQFDYQPTSAASGASFSWTRAAVTGIDNPAVTSPQDGAIAETLVNTTASAINVVYVYQVAAGTCYAAQNVTVQVLPGSLGGTVDGGTAVCAGANNTTLTLSGQRGVVVRWESSTTADFTENLTPIAHTSTTYNAINVATGTYYRAVVSNGGCAEAFSAVAFIGINELFPFYTDADGDGYGTGEAVMVCAVDANTPPTGYAAEEGDCDDQIAAINPGAADIPYNGVDDDCDGTIDETGTVTTT